LDPLIRSVSEVKTALSNISSVFQLFSFIVVCSGMISKGFGFVAFFASVESQFGLYSSNCLVCMLINIILPFIPKYFKVYFWVNFPYQNYTFTHIYHIFDRTYWRANPHLHILQSYVITVYYVLGERYDFKAIRFCGILSVWTPSKKRVLKFCID